MLDIQRYLRFSGTPESLTETLGITVYRHPALPLVGFKYSQIDSPKYHPIVRESRGVVLEDKTWNLVAKPFDRFFNIGEDPDAYAGFDWTNFDCLTKHDGSLCILYHYADEWHVNTSGSFGLGKVGGSGRTWRDLFWAAANIDKAELWKGYTYVFELCSLANKVIRVYPKPTAYLLSIFRSFSDDFSNELPPAAVDMEARMIEAERPERHHYKSIDDIRAFLEGMAATDKTFEGVVIRDSKGTRFKLKSESYLRLHRLHDNGNIFAVKRLIPVILAGEQAEVISYFPEIREPLEAAEAELTQDFDELAAIWRSTWQIESQRDFALATVKATPYSGLLFTLRKIYGENQTEALLRDQWNRSVEVILKRFAKRAAQAEGMDEPAMSDAPSLFALIDLETA